MLEPDAEDVTTTNLGQVNYTDIVMKIFKRDWQVILHYQNFYPVHFILLLLIFFLIIVRK